MRALGVLFVIFGIAFLLAMTPGPMNFQIGLNIPVELELKGQDGKDGVLAATMLPGGVVKYAYRADQAVDTAPSDKVLEVAGREKVRITDEILDRRTSHSRTFSTEGSNLAVTEIVAGDPQYYQDAHGEWSHIEYATTSEYAFNQQMRGSSVLASLLFSTAFAQSTFYSEANPSATVDGILYQSASCQTWSSLRGLATSTSVNDTATSEQLHLQSCGSSGEWDRLHRQVAGFDTSSIPDSDTIVSATESFYIDSKVDSATFNQAIGITSYTPASDDVLAIDDYDNFGSTRLASDIDIGSITTGGYVDWTYNATGRNAINKTGVTNTMLRFSGDIDNSEPTWGSSEESYIFVRFADTEVTSQDPKLVVVHEEAEPDLSNRKSASESVTGSTALQNDDELQLVLEASKTYIVDGAIFASSTSAAPDIAIAFTGQSGSNIKIGYTTADDNGILQASGVASSRIALRANTPTAILLKGTITTGSGGDLQLRWAQATSNGNATIVGAGSYLRAEEI